MVLGISYTVLLLGSKFLAFGKFQLLQETQTNKNGREKE